MIALPLPLDICDGAHVIASVWVNDEPDEPARALLVTIRHDAPNYRVVQVIERNGEWAKDYFEDFPNIVPAIRFYEDNGGDY